MNREPGEIDSKGVLYCENGCSIPPLDASSKLLLGRSVAIYGPSGSGKTVIVKDIMKILSGHIQQCIIVCPSEPSNRSYEGYVPQQMIHYRCGIDDARGANGRPLKGRAMVEHFLNLIIQRQTMLVGLYEQANDIACLRRLYARVRCPEGDRLRDALAQRRAAALRDLARRAPVDIDSKAEELGGKFDAIEGLICKKYVAPRAGELMEGGLGALGEDEQYSLQYMYLNPHLLVVFDDCAAELKSAFKDEQFRTLFYRGRHIKVTMLLCFQDDTDLDTNLRKNAFVSIYTSPVVAAAAFNRTANGYPKSDRDYVRDINPTLFQRHRKLVYLRESAVPFHYYTATLHRRFRFGSDDMWRLCARVQLDGKTLDRTNPYYEQFRLAAPPAADAGRDADHDGRRRRAAARAR